MIYSNGRNGVSDGIDYDTGVCDGVRDNNNNNNNRNDEETLFILLVFFH